MDLTTYDTSIIEKIVALLPTSPFQPYIDQIGDLPYLGYLNWFFPVSECLIVMHAWLLAVGGFYLYSVIMRWVKLIGD